MKGADAIVKTLIKQGTDITFGFPGGQVIPLFDAFLDFKKDIKNVLVRHEQGAVHAAEGYARASGKAGVCIATSGPGATNLVTGIMNAYMDSSPVIAFGGQVPVSLIGNDAFQETDMMGITIPITKHNFQIRDADEAVSTIMKAYKLALEGRPGPVYIDLPKDPQVGETNKFPKEVKMEGFCPTVNPNPMQIKKAAEAILKAERPLFLVGGGVIIANASCELNELVELVKIPVATTMMGKGAFDERHPLSLGVVGMHGRKIANYATVHADLIIAIGCRFSDRITGNLKTYGENAKIIHIDVDPAEIGKNVKVDIPIVGSAKNAIKGITETLKQMIKKQTDSAWTKRMKELGLICSQCVKFKETGDIHPKMVMDELNKILKAEDIVTTGVGQHQMFAMHYLKRSLPRTFISSGGAGTMGFGFPAALGAKVAKPDNDVFCIDGDGSFQMNIQELGTAMEEGIKTNVIVMNNSYLGMVRQWLEIFFHKRYSQVWLGKGPDLLKIADAYNLHGIRVTKPSEIAGALKEARKSDVTTIVDIKIEQESNILPMLPPGGHLKDAFGGCMKIQGQFFD